MKRSPSSSQLYGRWRFIVILEQRSTTRLRDRFVCGLRSQAIQRKLLSESNLTLQKAVEIALSTEAASRDASEMSSGVHVGSSRPAPSQTTSAIVFRLTRGHAAAAHTNIRVDLLAQERVGTLRVIRGRENVVTGVETNDTSLRTAHTRTKPAILAVSEAICQAHVEA